MAGDTAKSTKEIKMETAGRHWHPKPILAPEFTEDLPLQDVYVGILRERRTTSTAIQTLSTISSEFGHLKRCSGDKLLLVPVNSKEVKASDEKLSENDIKMFLKERGFDLSLLEDDFQILQVPQKPARTKAQAAKAAKVWPVNFHPDPTIESILSGSFFGETQLRLIENYMSIVIEAAKLESVGVDSCNGSAMIVDPSDGRILALAASRIDLHPMWHGAMLAVDLVASLHGGGAWNLKEENVVESSKTSNVKSDNLTSVDSEEKSQEKSDVKSRTKFEKRLRIIKRKYEEEAPLFFPRSLSKLKLPVQESLENDSKKRGRRNNTRLDTDKADGCKNSNRKCGPYLCTDYWVFLLKEPCPMCAMALLHSRVSKIFYGTANQSTGVLGTHAILHTLPGLNHRYRVWAGILGEECEAVSREIERTCVS